MTDCRSLSHRSTGGLLMDRPVWSRRWSSLCPVKWSLNTA